MVPLVIVHPHNGGHVQFDGDWHSQSAGHMHICFNSLSRPTAQHPGQLNSFALLNGLSIFLPRVQS